MARRSPDESKKKFSALCVHFPQGSQGPWRQSCWKTGEYTPVFDIEYQLWSKKFSCWNNIFLSNLREGLAKYIVCWNEPSVRSNCWWYYFIFALCEISFFVIFPPYEKIFFWKGELLIKLPGILNALGQKLLDTWQGLSVWSGWVHAAGGGRSERSSWKARPPS